MKKTRPLLSTPFLVVLGRLGGALIPFFLAHFYGVSPATDAFFFVFGVLLLALETFSHLLEAVLLPDLAVFQKRSEKMFYFGNSVLTVTLGISIVFFGFFSIAAPFFLGHWSGSGGEFAGRVSRLLLEMSPFLFLGACTCMANGIFYAHKIFWMPALSPLIRSGIVVISILLAHGRLGIHAATQGFAAGEAVRTSLTFLLLAQLTSWRPKLHWKEIEGEVKVFLNHAAFQVLAIVAFNLFLVTDQWFASRLGEGKLSLFSYSDRLFLIPYQLFGAGFLHILHSDWSDLYHQEPTEIFLAKIGKDIRVVLGIAAVFSFLAWGFSPFAVRLAFGHGHMQPEDLRVIGTLFGWQMIGFIPAVVNLIYSRIFFILKKSRFYFAYSWGRFFLKVVLNVLFMGIYGLKGIVVSTVMVNLSAAAWLHFYLRRYLKEKHSCSF